MMESKFISSKNYEDIKRYIMKVQDRYIMKVQDNYAKVQQVYK